MRHHVAEAGGETTEPGTLENDVDRRLREAREVEPRALLEAAKVIAVVGFSTNPGKAAHAVPMFLQSAGYRVIPVHPTAETIAGERVYRALDEVPGPVDIVDVFRPACEAAEIARQAVRIRAGALWLQEGIRSVPARKIALADGLAYVEDLCIAKVVAALIRR